MKRSQVSIVAVLLVLSMVLAACGATEEPTVAPKPTEAGVTAAEGDFLERAKAGEFDGTSVFVMGAFAGGDEEARFVSVNDRFTEQTGIGVTYEGTRDFEVTINTRVEGGDPPDVALVPQPGLKDKFAAAGELVPLWDSIVARINGNYSPVWLDLGSYEGTPYGVFHRVNAKSFVWYPKKAFEAAGYTEPTSWDELIALSDQIVADGGVPWCVGLESQAATGWPATDWMEDIMLRTGGPDVYDQWVSHEVPFDSEQVRTAAGYIEQIWFNEDYVYGGTTGILQGHFADVSDPMWDDPPGCWMIRQGNFVTSFWPDEVQANLDEEVGAFGFPPIDEQWGLPVLGGGDQIVAFEDRPEVRAYMEFLTTGESAEPWARAGGALFPHQDQQLDWYQTEIERTLVDLLLNAKVFRFDASDLMPKEVGSGSFWTGMVDWVAGTDLDTVLQEIDASWPQ
jgi:alpha-glucoside transport system substrate-binding protein